MPSQALSALHVETVLAQGNDPKRSHAHLIGLQISTGLVISHSGVLSCGETMQEFRIKQFLH